jgi:hypothetical protein
MTDSSPSPAIVTIRSDEPMLERLALVGFLAGYSGPTRDSHRTDLRMFVAWLADRQVRLLDVQRTHVELYGRWREEQGRVRSTVGRRLSTLAGFTATPNKNRSWSARQRRMCGARSRTTSPARSGWTATSSAPSWSRPGCHRTATTPWRRCWPTVSRVDLCAFDHAVVGSDRPISGLSWVAHRQYTEDSPRASWLPSIAFALDSRDRQIAAASCSEGAGELSRGGRDGSTARRRRALAPSVGRLCFERSRGA